MVVWALLQYYSGVANEPLQNDEDRHESALYDANGVDRTLVRACLRDSALERLEALEAVYLLRESVSRVREPIPPTD
jgi:hypothetical protein